MGINNILTKEIKVSLENFPKEIPESLRQSIIERELITVEIQTVHHKYDVKGNIISTEEFDLDENESEGTKKLFALAGLILRALREGKVILIDELDSKLHPLITKTLIELFNSNDTNPKNAQLIFTTQDTNLLSNKIFRKDQIWFTEKNQYEVTDLYSLVEYNNVSEEASFENDYIKGKYGAIPYIGNLKDLV